MAPGSGITPNCFQGRDFKPVEPRNGWEGGLSSKQHSTDRSLLVTPQHEDSMPEHRPQSKVLAAGSLLLTLVWGPYRCKARFVNISQISKRLALAEIIRSIENFTRIHSGEDLRKTVFDVLVFWILYIPAVGWLFICPAYSPGPNLDFKPRKPSASGSYKRDFVLTVFFPPFNEKGGKVARALL